MNEGGLSETAMLAGLRDIHLPPGTAGDNIAEIAAAVALAGLAALLLASLFRLFSLRRPTARVPNAADRVAALAALPEPARRIACLHLLRDHAPERYALLKDRLYRPRDSLDLETLQAEVERHV